MTSLNLLAIDPGSSNHATSHTGIVALGLPKEIPALILGSWAVRGGLDGFRDWHEDTGLLRDSDIVIVEQFVDQQVMGGDRSPMLIEGAIRFLRPDTILSPPSGYKKAVPDDVLKRLGLWFTGDHHADRNSAARHALRYLRKTHPPTAEAGWGWIKEKYGS